VVLEGLLDTPGNWGADALVDRQCLPQVRGARSASTEHTSVRRGFWHAVEPSFVRAELADRAPRSQSPTRTHG
jgi:hypothetical protein